jgi:alpha-tubulin suppressor-like RCC1 family protein
VSCGAFHTVALTENGEAYSWGSNTYGQCGNSQQFLTNDEPKKVDFEYFIHVSYVSAG